MTLCFAENASEKALISLGSLNLDDDMWNILKALLFLLNCWNGKDMQVDLYKIKLLDEPNCSLFIVKLNNQPYC